MADIMKIVVTLNEKGQVGAEGNIENMMIAFGLLEAAKDAVRGYHAEMAKTVKPASEDDIKRLALVAHKN